MSARVMTLLYFLQGIIEISCLKIKTCARMVLFDRDEGGGRIRDHPGWYEFIGQMHVRAGVHVFVK